MLSVKFSAVILLTTTFEIAASSADIGKNPFLVGGSFNANQPQQQSNNINNGNSIFSSNGQAQTLYYGQSATTQSPSFGWLQTPISHTSSNTGDSQTHLSGGQDKPSVFLPPKNDVTSGIHQPIASVVTAPQLLSHGGETNKGCLRLTGQFPTGACNKFINCWNGVATEQACPDGLYFSAKGLYCDYPERVDCGQRSIATANVHFHQPLVLQQPTPVPTLSATHVTQGSTNSPAFAVQTTQAPPFVIGGKSNHLCLQLRGQFPTNVCNKYVNCWDGAAVEEACPAGLLFNPAKLNCDYPENVNCNGKLIVGSTPVTSSSPSFSIPTSSGHITSPTPATVAAVVPAGNQPLKNKCLTSRGVFPTSACNKFVSCFDEKVEEKACPEGFLFSTRGYCDSAENVVCGDRITKTKDAHTGLECLKESGTFRDKDSCGSYYTCAFNKVIAKFRCPEGLHFNDEIGICDYAEKVKCYKDSLASQKEDAVKKSECPLENGTFRDRTKCNHYFTCLANKVVARYDCPDGFNFNDYIGVCDYAARVDCSKEPQIFEARKGVYQPTYNGVENVECPVEFGTFRHDKNCSAYYTCVNKKIVAKYDCPTGFSFNDDLGICDYAERVDCSKPPKIFQVNQKGLPQLPVDFQERVNNCKTGTLFRLNPQCTSVCLCREGGAEIVQCPAGFAFDSVLNKCVLTHLARC